MVDHQVRIREIERRLEALRAELAEVQALAAAEARQARQIWARLPSRGDGITMRAAVTPAGGIPAASGTGNFTPGSATCTFLEWNGTVLSLGAAVVVKNKYTVAIGGNKRIDIYQSQGDWWQSTEQCP